ERDAQVTPLSEDLEVETGSLVVPEEAEAADGAEAPEEALEEEEPPAGEWEAAAAQAEADAAESETAEEAAPAPGELDRVDDRARQSLREIHRVKLLTAQEERRLAARLEEQVVLAGAAAEEAVDGEPASDVDAALVLYRRLSDRGDLIDALCAEAGL